MGAAVNLIRQKDSARQEAPASALPNFFIVGAPKAGTTSLYHWLSTHRDVYMSPVKEPSYFSQETRLENFAARFQPMVRKQMAAVLAGLNRGELARNETRGIVAEWHDYVRLFSGVSGQKAIGEASVFYLWSQTAARAIARHLPGSHILMVLRDPAERVFSQYLHFSSFGHSSLPFPRYLKMCLGTYREINPYYPALELGFYARQVERYLEAFPARQIRIWLYEDTISDPARFHREVLEFLEIDPEGASEIAQRHFEVPVPTHPGMTHTLRRLGLYGFVRNLLPGRLRARMRPAFYRSRRAVSLPAEERAFLVDYYKADVSRLERLIGRDLSAWKRV